MTTIKKCLATRNDKPNVTAIIDFNRRWKWVEVNLEGTILDEHITALRDFLQNVSYFPGKQWALQLEDLEVISLQALRVLLKFAKVIRQRGHEVQIKSIQASVLVPPCGKLNVREYFAWKNINRVNSLSKTPNQEEWRHHETSIRQL